MLIYSKYNYLLPGNDTINKKIQETPLIRNNLGFYCEQNIVTVM